MAKKLIGKKFITKDSGERKFFKSGMQRDVQEGKRRYDLLYPPLLQKYLVKTAPEGKIEAVRVFFEWFQEKDVEAEDVIKKISEAEGLTWEDTVDRWEGLMARGAIKY